DAVVLKTPPLASNRMVGDSVPMTSHHSDAAHHRWASMVLAGVMLLAACTTSSRVPMTLGDSTDLAAGRQLYLDRCAGCHGIEAKGTAQGPPLVDEIYRPSHHADGAFLVAIIRGAPQHHWDFGPMPPQEGLTDREVTDIVGYVRYLQTEAGIR
ncbi:MAG: c-type cytochrome, partial [Acidimicrobiia bacterium]